MPDSKITALASIGTGTDPVNDALVIVDVSDVSPGGMSATGTTKRVSLNNLLASSPTATLASATITGALTANGGISMANATAITSSGAVALYVDTNQLVLRARATNGILFQESTGVNNLLTISNAGVFGFLDGAGGTRMTLNATGLGVGGSPVNFPNYTTIHAIGKTTTAGGVFQTSTSNNSTAARFACSSTGVDLFVETNHPLAFYTNAIERMRIDTAGNPIFQPSATPATLGTNGMLTVNATSNTNLRFSYRGSDGVTRVANLTLA